MTLQIFRYAKQSTSELKFYLLDNLPKHAVPHLNKRTQKTNRTKRVHFSEPCLM